MDSELSQQLLHHVQRLEHHLSLESGEDQVWFAPAEPEIISEITRKYALPEMYLEFLKTFSPRDVNVVFYALFAAEDLIEAQSKWERFTIDGAVAIGETGLDDPILLDLKKSNGVDAPVVYAMHDNFDLEGEDYSSMASGFLEFLEFLVEIVEQTQWKTS